MKNIYVAAICAAMLAPAQAMAADMPAPSPYTGGGLVEIGTGWYLRGDVGASLDSVPALSFSPGALSAPPPASISPGFGPVTNKTDFTGGGGVGYKFNSFFRADATFDFRTGMGTNKTASGIICPYTSTGLTSQTQTTATGAPLLLGYAYNANDTCNASMQVTQNNYTTLANAYFDLPGFWGVTPYVGAGAGLNIQTTNGSLAYTQSSNGKPYRADLSLTGAYPLVWVNPINGQMINPQPKIAFAPQNWDRSLKSTKYGLAIALMGGIGIALTPNATLDISYRYMDLGSTTVLVNPQTGATISQRNTAQEVRVGLRYMPDWTF